MRHVRQTVARRELQACVLAIAISLLPWACKSGAQTMSESLVTAPASTNSLASRKEKIDTAIIQKVKEEALKRSQVMELISWMCDVYGPRLTNSPNERAAAQWALKTFADWGLTNPHLEKWGPFGRSWKNEIGTARAVSPQPFQIYLNVGAWTPSTEGPVTGEIVLVDSVRFESDLEKLRGKLKGKILFTSSPREVKAHFNPDAKRHTMAGLDSIAMPPAPRPQPQMPPPQRPAPDPNAPKPLSDSVKLAFYIAEGAVARLSVASGDDGTMFGGGGGNRNVNAPPMLPGGAIAVEHYGRIYRMIKKGIPVTVELNIKNSWEDSDLNSNNVIAEIPGTDKKDEIVMIGAHFDSWHYGTGATDNGAGSAVMMEAMRILKKLNVPLRRTVRIGLWTGEETGLFGSTAYVREHFGDQKTMALKAEHAKFAAYFNVDNGTGAIRGVYQQSNEAVGPIFKEWIQYFNDIGMTHVTIRNTGGTDHLAFDAVGLPGFQFIQDPIDYDSRTHHSNMDVYERIQADDMMKNAAIVAAFVYIAANRDEMLPRKPLPAPSKTF
jgi:carboxypeptidase Q